MLSRMTRSRSRHQWSSRLVAGFAGLLFLATLASPAYAEESMPSSSSSSSSTETLAELQQKAAQVQQEFMDASVAYEAAQQQVADARAKADEARNTEAAALAEMTRQQDALGAYVSTVYQMGIVERHPMLKIIAYGPKKSGDLLHEQQIANIVGDQQSDALDLAEAAKARADEASKAAADAEQKAADASAAAQAILDDIQARAAQISSDLNKNLSSLGTSASNAEQEARNKAALSNWQDYLQRLSDAKVSRSLALPRSWSTDRCSPSCPRRPSRLSAPRSARSGSRTWLARPVRTPTTAPG
jgi:hypothetical protein